MTQWVKDSLPGLVVGAQGQQGAATVRITALTSCTGEAHQWLVRGTKRAGFELELEIRWEAVLDPQGGAEPVSGAAK